LSAVLQSGPVAIAVDFSWRQLLYRMDLHCRDLAGANTLHILAWNLQKRLICELFFLGRLILVELLGLGVRFGG
jgi:hypothetical protein